MTVLEILKLATEYLEKFEIENARLNAELLLSDVLNCKRLELYTNFDKPLKEDELQKYREFLKRRAKGEPLQYITGKTNFFGLEFTVSPGVLIPRPETELLVEEVINAFEKDFPLHILDVCSGSGNIGITLAKHFPRSFVTCVDISEKAIEIGKLNSEKLKVKNISFQLMDILNQVPEGEIFDVIVSNPPYVSEKKKETLQKEVRLYEPHIALFVENEMEYYKRIVEFSEDLLKDMGKIFFEIDDELADLVVNFMKEKNFKSIKITKDYSGLNRVISGVKER